MSLACPAVIAALDPALCHAVDHYCERLGPGWDAEPINALTNLAFFVAGWAAWRRLAGTPGGCADRPLLALTVMMPIVGLGSMVFHTLATRWAEWADVGPIVLFMLLYLWVVFSRFYRWPVALQRLVLAGFCAATVGIEAAVPGDVLWGGALYLPTVLTLVAIGATAPRIDAETRRVFLFAVGGFLLAFTMRTLDRPLCAWIPIGTHMWWHVFNAAVLFLLVEAAIRQRRRRAGDLRAAR